MSTTEIQIHEDGSETHESWLLIRANQITGSRHLFDSEIRHQHWIQVTVTRCTRRRDLKRDWMMNGKVILEMDMSQAQWGAFVSSFGQGTGVPATLTRLDGEVPQAPYESRLAESMAEVKDAGAEALAEVQAAAQALQEAFDAGAGKKVMRERLSTLNNRLGNAPANMAFAAESLSEHVESVVTKARADIEGMVLSAQENQQLVAGTHPLLNEGEKA